MGAHKIGTQNQKRDGVALFHQYNYFFLLNTYIELISLISPCVKLCNKASDLPVRKKKKYIKLFKLDLISHSQYSSVSGSLSYFLVVKRFHCQRPVCISFAFHLGFHSSHTDQTKEFLSCVGGNVFAI